MTIRPSIARVLILLGSALLVNGCGIGSKTRLPEITTSPRPLLSPAEQQAAIADLERRKRELDASTVASKPAH